jgi:uncharacterized repeat protein (TIGR03803 family)
VIRTRDLCITFFLLCGLGLFAAPAHAAAFSVLHTFTDGSDGAEPYSGVIMDSAGNLYGTTQWGGVCYVYGPPINCGVVFKVAKDGTETILHTFCTEQSCPDGLFPSSGLIADKAGNLYGTTSFGGAIGGGTLYRLAPDGTESVLYSFGGGNDGAGPGGNFIRDKAGNFYGTTYMGGAHGTGTLFKLAANGTLSVLYAFAGGSEGNTPQGVSADSAGNLYVLMQYGGDVTDCPGAKYVQPGCGTVLKLTPGGAATVLHTFTGGSDGQTPYGSLLVDSSGNLFGTSQAGGGTDCNGFGPGCGTIFRIAADGSESVFYAFTGGRNGAVPRAGLIADAAGNLLGTTYSGGSNKGSCGVIGGCGTVFEVTPNGTATVLHVFNTAASNPWASLLLHRGTLYGTTLFGGGTGCDGTGCGTVFQLKE